MLLNRLAFCFKNLKRINLFYEIKYLILTYTINLVRRYKKIEVFLCVRVSFFFLHFCDFDFTLQINKMLYLKNKMSDSTQNRNAFWKIIVQDKCQGSKNFKK